MKNVPNQTEPESSTRLNNPKKTATYGTIPASRFSRSNCRDRSLCGIEVQNLWQEQSDRSSPAWRWQPFMDHVMGKSWCQWETPLPCHDLTSEKSHKKTTRTLLFKTSCHIHSMCRRETGSILEMQIPEHLHLCAVGVTKSFGVVGRAPPFMGTWNGGFEHLNGSSKSEPAQREAMFGGGVISSHSTKYGRTHPYIYICSFCPDCIGQRRSVSINWEAMARTFADLINPPVSWRDHIVWWRDHRGDSDWEQLVLL